MRHIVNVVSLRRKAGIGHRVLRSRRAITQLDGALLDVFVSGIVLEFHQKRLCLKFTYVAE
jgi:hypothetical protein